MKKLLFALFIFSFSLCDGQSWLWGTEAKGSLKGTSPFGSGVAVDLNGNAFLSATFSDGVDIFGSDTIITRPENSALLVKYNSNGDALWVRGGGINNNINSTSQSDAIDRTGNVYQAGWVVGQLIIIGTDTVYGHAEQNSFLAKYDGNGNLIWIKCSNEADTIDNNYGNSLQLGCVATDKHNNAFIIGTFYDTNSFGTFRLINPYSTTNSYFIAKYDSNGNVIWANQAFLASGNCSASGSAIATDSSSNIIVVGSFTDTISIGLTILTGVNSTFLVKYNPNGAVLWAKLISSGNSLGPVISNGVTTDISGNIYVTGGGYDTLVFGTDTIVSLSNQAFFAKYDPSGNLIWVKQIDSWYGNSLFTDDSNHIYLTLSGASDSLKYQNYLLNTPSIHPAVILKLDSSGKVLNGSYLYDGLGYLNASSDPSGKFVYMTGMNVDGEPIIYGSDTIMNPGMGNYPYLVRWNPYHSTDAILTIQSSNPSLILFPNPTTGIFNIALVGAKNLLSATVEIYNVLGEKVYSQFNIQNPTFKIDLSSQPNGIYLYRVLNVDGGLLGEGKMVIQK